MDIKKIFTAGFIGLASGFICTLPYNPFNYSLLLDKYENNWLNGSFFSYLFSPGLVFGLAVWLIYFVFFRKVNAGNFIIFIIFNILAYHLAYYATFLFFFIQDPTHMIPFFLGGYLGSLVVLIALKTLVVRFSTKDVFKFSIISGLLAWGFLLPGWVISDDYFGHGLGPSPSGNLPYFYLYVIWQVGMAILIATILEVNKNKFNNNSNQEANI